MTYQELVQNEKKCCGCSACFSICPTQAIKMVENEEGFLYPNVDGEKCINCGACLQVCAFKNSSMEKAPNQKNVERCVYATRAKDEEILKVSSSGGMYTVLSDYVLANDGIIAASCYNYATNTEEYRLISNTSERDSSRGSKYVQSITGNIFEECAEWLRDNPNKPLLFIGMGCQVAGFQSYITHKGLEKKVFLVDIICHGTPSPKVWRDYIEMLERKYAGEVSKLEFKDKRNGWKRPTAYVRINNKEVTIRDYVKIFYNQCSLRPSCHFCPYATVKRNVDMTIGDFWGIDKLMPDFYNEKGNSLVILHTNKGRLLFEAVKEKIDYRESNLKDCLQPNLVRPTPMAKNRKTFWIDYFNKGIDYVVNKYGRTTIKERVIRKIKNILNGILYKHIKKEE